MMNFMLSSTQIEGLQWATDVSTLLVIAVLLGVVLWSVFLYRSRRGLPSYVRWGLLVARVLVLSLVVISFFEPIAVVRETQEVRRPLAVLVDVSQSMSIKDNRKSSQDVVDAAVALGQVNASEVQDADTAALTLNSKEREAIAEASRLDLASALLSNTAKPALDTLGENVDINYYAFGDSVRMLGERSATGEQALASLSAEQAGTSLADALETVARTNRSVPLAGIVLLTDGLDTSTRQAEAVVRDLGIQGVEVYPVAVGLTDPDDVSIRNVVMQEVAFSGDKVPIRVQVQSKGYEKRDASLTVRLNGRQVAQKDITLDGGLQFEDIFFNVDEHEKGSADVEIMIEPFADEATPQNNRHTRSVRIVNERINVLCIEGSARWEYRYLRAMLKRDPRINATFIATRAEPAMARNSSEYISRFPDSREEAFNYDLVILGDVDASFFTGDEFLRLEELVKERGGSLLMLCGSSYSPSSYAGTPIEQMLPVRFVPGGEWEDIDDRLYPVLTPEGQSSLVMTLEMDQDQNDRVWSRVAPLYRVPALLEPRPGATVLATLSDANSRMEPYPLVAWQRYGTGKTMMIGTDRLWLLRFKTGDKYHWRVWSQCIQFLTLSRLMGEHKRIRLETDRSTYPVNGHVQLYAHLLDDRYEPVMQASFEVLVTPLDVPNATPQRIALRPHAKTPGLYEGSMSAVHPGTYRVEANESDRDLANSTEFQVADMQPEMAETSVQVERLGRMAELSGGQMLSFQQIGQLPSLIETTPHEISFTTQVSLWDNAWVLFLLIVLVGTEWIVRRRYDLP